ncbi:hypothetical protein MNBD_GAMMA04-1841, partial [hydrothermal vent metagenome]
WLENPEFKAGLEGWKISNPQYIKQNAFGVVTLSLPEPKKYLALYQRFRIDSRLSQTPEGMDRTQPLLLQLSGIVRTFAVRKEVKDRYQGRLSLAFYDDKGKRININSIALPSHSSRWQEYRKVFKVPEQAASVRMNVHMWYATGSVQVKALHLVPVKQKAEAKVVQYVGLAIWIGMMIWLMWGYARSIWQTSKVTVLFVSVLMLGAIISGDMKQQLMNQLPELLFSMTSFLVVTQDMLAHFLFFFIAALVMVSVCHHKAWWQVVVDLILLGIFIECAQVFVEGRTADFMDIWVDILGVVTGGLVAWFWLLIRSFIRR